MIFTVVTVLIAIIFFIWAYVTKFSPSKRYFFTNTSGWSKSQDILKNQDSTLEIKSINPETTSKESFKSLCDLEFKTYNGSNLSFGETTFRGRSGYKCSFDSDNNTHAIFYIPSESIGYQAIILNYPATDPSKINDLINGLVLY